MAAETETRPVRLRDEEITDLLVAAQKPKTAYLWVPADAITFTPAVLTETFGDGRALFAITTINNRPAYWIVQGCSSWKSGLDTYPPHDAGDICEAIDEILTAIEEEFGSSDLYTMNRDGRWIDGDTGQFVPNSYVDYPVIDTRDGCSWGRLNWPDLPGIELKPHPFASRVRILANPACEALPPSTAQAGGGR